MLVWPSCDGTVTLDARQEVPKYGGQFCDDVEFLNISHQRHQAYHIPRDCPVGGGSRRFFELPPVHERHSPGLLQGLQLYAERPGFHQEQTTLHERAGQKTTGLWQLAVTYSTN